MHKKFFNSTLAVFLFFLISCDPNEDALPNAMEYTIPYGSCIPTIKFNEICFDSLVEDSRCPLNVLCPWTGIGIVQLKITANNSVQYIKLGTLKNASTIFPPNDTMIHGMKITLKALNPYPTGLVVPSSAYSVQLKIE